MLIIGGLGTILFVLFFGLFIWANLQYVGQEMGNEAFGYTSFFGMATLFFAITGIPLLYFSRIKMKKIKNKNNDPPTQAIAYGEDD